jgi:hypothetical protein
LPQSFLSFASTQEEADIDKVLIGAYRLLLKVDLVAQEGILYASFFQGGDTHGDFQKVIPPS